MSDCDERVSSMYLLKHLLVNWGKAVRLIPPSKKFGLGCWALITPLSAVSHGIEMFFSLTVAQALSGPPVTRQSMPAGGTGSSLPVVAFQA